MAEPIQDVQTIYCKPLSPENLPPQYFTQLAKWRSDICKWVSDNMIPIYDKVRHGSEDTFDISIVDSFPNVSNEALRWPIASNPKAYFRYIISNWNDAITHLKTSRTDPSTFTGYFATIAFGPYVLALALALQIVKIYYKD